MRFDYLSAILKINLVAIIMRRIVTRRDYDSGGRISMANRERELRSRSRRPKKENVATQLGCDLSSKLGKLAGKKSGILGKRQSGPAGGPDTGGPTRQGINQPLHRPTDILQIQCVSARAGRRRVLG